MAVLRYIGKYTTSFVYREVHPGDEFTVPDELAESYARREDVILVSDGADSALPLSKPATAGIKKPAKADLEVPAVADLSPTTPPQEG